MEAGKAPPTPSAGGVGLLAAVLGAGLLTLLVAGIAATYDAVKEGDGLALVDQPVLTWMVAHHTAALDTAVTAVTDIGGPTLLPIIATLVTLLAWRWRSWTLIAFMVLAAAGSLATTAAGKDLAARARPPQSLGPPSAGCQGQHEDAVSEIGHPTEIARPIHTQMPGNAVPVRRHSATWSVPHIAQDDVFLTTETSLR